MLMVQTNMYASKMISQNGPVRRSSMIKTLIPKNIEEIKLFLGLLVHIRPFTMLSLDSY